MPSYSRISGPHKSRFLGEFSSSDKVRQKPADSINAQLKIVRIHNKWKIGFVPFYFFQINLSTVSSISAYTLICKLFFSVC